MDHKMDVMMLEKKLNEENYRNAKAFQALNKLQPKGSKVVGGAGGDSFLNSTNGNHFI
jgi:hypothetical protein